MKIKYFSWLKDITKVESEEITNDSITDIDSLKKYLSNNYPKIRKYLIDEKIIRIAINLEYTNENVKIFHKDEIALFPPVSGG